MGKEGARKPGETAWEMKMTLLSWTPAGEVPPTNPRLQQWLRPGPVSTRAKPQVAQDEGQAKTQDERPEET